MAQRNLDHAEFQVMILLLLILRLIYCVQAQRDDGVDAPDRQQTQTVNHLDGESQVVRLITCVVKLACLTFQNPSMATPLMRQIVTVKPMTTVSLR